MNDWMQSLMKLKERLKKVKYLGSPTAGPQSRFNFKFLASIRTGFPINLFGTKLMSMNVEIRVLGHFNQSSTLLWLLFFFYSSFVPASFVSLLSF